MLLPLGSMHVQHMYHTPTLFSSWLWAAAMLLGGIDLPVWTFLFLSLLSHPYFPISHNPIPFPYVPYKDTVSRSSPNCQPFTLFLQSNFKFSWLLTQLCSSRIAFAFLCRVKHIQWCYFIFFISRALALKRSSQLWDEKLFLKTLKVPNHLINLVFMYLSFTFHESVSAYFS